MTNINSLGTKELFTGAYQKRGGQSSSRALLDTAEKCTTSKRINNVQQNTVNMPTYGISISEEGRKALREMVSEFKPEPDCTDIYELTIQDTNEVAWEHYTAMREMSSLTLKDGNYNVEDLMKSMMDAYETLYNEIVKEHETGNRQVSYELTGENSLTLEEDLAGLDKAYEMRLANLAGYITCQQTNKIFKNPGDISWYFNRNGLQYSKENSPQNKEMKQSDYDYFDEEYRNTAISMMKQAREEFLSVFKTQNYKGKASIGIISNIMNNNADFLIKTEKLFS